MPKYKREVAGSKTIYIDAVQYTGNNLKEIRVFCNGEPLNYSPEKGDYVLKILNQITVCPRRTFESTYKPDFDAEDIEEEITMSTPLLKAIK